MKFDSAFHMWIANCYGCYIKFDEKLQKNYIWVYIYK